MNKIITKQEKDLINGLFKDLVLLIDESKQRITVEVNSTVVQLYWLIGNRVNAAILKNDRADYGEKVIDQISN